MSRKVDVRVISHDDARRLCEAYHYSRKISTKSGLPSFGVWEDGKIKGAIVYGFGASPNLGTKLGLGRKNVAELTRVAFTKHRCQVSQPVAYTTRLIRKKYPFLGAIVSFADPMQDHHGGIYQAMGWVYTGKSPVNTTWLIDGIEFHERSVGAKYVSTNLEHVRRVSGKTVEIVRTPGKFRYILPLNDEVRALVEGMRLPYPKSLRAGSIRDAAADQAAEGGSIPTPALQQGQR